MYMFVSSYIYYSSFAVVKARFSIIQKYKGGHTKRNQNAALAWISAMTTSFSFLSKAFKMRSAHSSADIPFEVALSISKVEK